jgi:hypothetical protein
MLGVFPSSYNPHKGTMLLCRAFANYFCGSWDNMSFLKVTYESPLVLGAAALYRRRAPYCRAYSLNFQAPYPACHPAIPLGVLHRISPKQRNLDKLAICYSFSPHFFLNKNHIMIFLPSFRYNFGIMIPVIEIYGTLR